MPINRPSRKFVPQTGRRESRPNVFIQSDEQRRASANASVAPATEVAGEAVDTAKRRVGRVRPGRPRSEVFTRTVGKELRQIGVLTVATFAVLGVLAVVLN